jgi:hypothetical protein
MTVYIVIGIERYEPGAPIYGIFTIKEKADEVCAKKQGASEFVNVFSYELDQETDE